MDHLPLPKEPVLPHSEISYCCSDEFSLPIGPFSTYPERKGYSLDGILQGAYDDKEHYHKAELVQEWLFLACFPLCSMFQEWKSLDNLTGPGSFYKKAVKSSAIPGYIREWAGIECRAIRDVKLSHAEQVMDILKQAQEMVSSLC